MLEKLIVVNQDHYQSGGYKIDYNIVQKTNALSCQQDWVSIITSFILPILFCHTC
jgi:hypothetical protein